MADTGKETLVGLEPRPGWTYVGPEFSSIMQCSHHMGLMGKVLMFMTTHNGCMVAQSVV